MAAKKKRSTPQRGKRRAVRRKRTARGGARKYWIIRTLVIVGVVLIGYLAYLDITIRRQFEGQRWALPAHVYTRPLEIFAGSRLAPAALLKELESLGYRKQAQADRPGSFTAVGDKVHIHLREFTFWDGSRPARFIRVRFRGNRVVAVTNRRGGGIDLAQLEPRLIGSVSPMHHEDRSLVQLADVPQALIDALLAVEDRGFYRHIGIDPRGLVRALWANITAGEVVQGGSTLTQQLVKNYYLSAERTVQRKLNEMTMALLLELHYSKDEILEAYLNEVYLGQAGNRAIHGFGLGSQFYFGRPLHELELPELALLVALVRGASHYNPRRHPERARERRNLVLGQMEERGFIDSTVARRARAASLGVPRQGAVVATAYPAFLDLVRRQLQRDYRDEDLHVEGLHIFTTLDPAVQAVVESEVARRLARLERERGLLAGSLQAAVVVARTDNGEVLALAGGRAARFAGFNRALDAQRPVGSLIKPAVYLAALEQGGRYTLATVLDDAPLTVEQAGAEVWRPQNYDREFRGGVLLVDALARSHNVPTARLGMEIGVETVTAMLRRLGLQRELQPYPSLLLGAASMSPLEMTQLYLNFASGGFRLPLKSTRSVLAQDLQPLARYPLSIEQVIEPEPMSLLNYALQEVVRSGTARSLQQRFSADLALAGKTGTTDGYRDSWFAGYSGDILALVWVGRDDNEPTGLSGASGAMRVWADIMSRLDLRELQVQMPPQVELLAVDDQGRQAEGCMGTRSMPFVAGSEPVDSAPCATTRVVRETSGKIKRFFERLFNESEN